MTILEICFSPFFIEKNIFSMLKANFELNYQCFDGLPEHLLKKIKYLSPNTRWEGEDT